MCSGTSGHGAVILKNTAAEKVQYILNKFLAYRSDEEAKLASDPTLTLGDVTTVNLTTINGGIQSNVVPSEITMLFDCRLAIDVDHDAFVQQVRGCYAVGGNQWTNVNFYSYFQLQKWCTEAGGNVKLEFEQKDPRTPATPLDDSNPFWVAFESVLVDEM